MSDSKPLSPNFNDRLQKLDMLVLHYTGMESGKAALKRMCDPKAEVSAHYMIWEDGRITNLVPEDKRAWHAGVSVWQGDEDLNSRSIGIEIVNGGHDVPLEDGRLPPYPDAQISAVIALCQTIIKHHRIPQKRIVAHSDIAPNRKRDPGEHFPWAALAKQGVGLWPSDTSAKHDDAQPVLIGTGLLPGDTGEPVRRLQQQLSAIGYGIDINGAFDAQTKNVVTAFQRRWMPQRLDGHGDLETIARVGAVHGLYVSNAAPKV